MTTATATIAQTSVAVPEHTLTQDAVKDALRTLLALGPERLQAVLALFDSAGVNSRHSVLPVAALHTPRTLSDTMAIYREHALRLGRRVAADCLARASLPAAAIDLVITVSCTGVMIPSLDAYLANDLGFRSDVRRMPITELGCLGGAAALSHANDFIAGHPQANVLLVSVELPTLSFQSGDLSTANLVSTAIFGDGAAAALLTGRPVAGAKILETQSHLFPRSIDALGFDLKDDGFHVVLARELPGLLRADIRGLVTGLLARAQVPMESVRAWVLHPGGRKILDAIEDQLGLTAEQLAPSRAVLRDHGNMSSAAVLFVLHEWLTGCRPPAGTHGLLGGFGPGFSADLLVLEWT